MRRILSVLLVVVLCCGLVVGCVGKSVDKKIPMLHNTELYLSSLKKDVEAKENLIEQEDGSYLSDKSLNLKDEQYKVTYYFDASEKISTIIYRWKKNIFDKSEDKGIILLNYTRSFLEDAGWNNNHNDYWNIKNNAEFEIYVEYPMNSNGDKDRIMLLVKSNLTVENDISTAKEAFLKTQEKTQGEIDMIAKDQMYNQKSTEINKNLQELIMQDKYIDLIENWGATTSSIGNSCDISVELQAAADVNVGTISAIRNVLSDSALVALPELSEISVDFEGIGTYKFTVGTGWDREVLSSDSE